MAFIDLSTCRAMGMAEGAIPFDKIEDYAEKRGLVGESEYRFTTLIRGLDVEYLAYSDRKSNKK